ALVLLHGLSDSSWSFAGIVPRLTGVRSVAVDLRGHGSSAAPASGYRPEDLADDVAALMDHLRIDRATIVGHSLGSMVARAFALRYASRVGRLVLVATIATPVNEAAAELGAAVAEFTDPVPEDFVREFQVSTSAEAVPEGYFGRVISESLRLPAHVWREAVAGIVSADDSGRLGQITVPTLLVWGDRDAWFPREEQDRVTAAIPGARLAVLEGAGHAPHWERPDDVAAVLADFLHETA
ncbi:MAG TPA: alpha/beta hydrolase, partial [Jiangellales bacterium]|nr:alpha/beta hydrolase [Jiangellales bacterium]